MGTRRQRAGLEPVEQRGDTAPSSRFVDEEGDVEFDPATEPENLDLMRRVREQIGDDDAA